MAHSPRLIGVTAGLDLTASLGVTTGTVPSHPVIVRAGAVTWAALLRVLLTRYPHDEWATFARFGWRDTPDGLVVTLAALDVPATGELDSSVGHVAIQEPYTLRVALAAEAHPLAVGVIHSHPEGSRTWPSIVDDDMDGYYAPYFAGFAPGRPYVSLIVARDGSGPVRASGRVYWHGRWHQVTRFLIPSALVSVDSREPPARPVPPPASLARVARLASALGDDAAHRLAGATVAVVGASGTGSPAVEVLARAGVGHIITVDPDIFAPSNLERVHGAVAADVPDGDEPGIPKVALARRHIHSINPACRVTAIHGALPQAEVLDAVLHADVVLGCTDQQHSRAALSDLAARYLVPVLDVGVSLEGDAGHMSGLIVQLTRFLAEDPCVYCRGMVRPAKIAKELMSPAEQQLRQAAARAAQERGDQGGAYWHDDPQLNTVGFLTTAAGGMAAGYVIGWITGRFELPFERLQMNLAAPYLDVTNTTADDIPARATCGCRRAHGQADQGGADAFINPPAHWPPSVVL
jgi:ThiF family